MDVLYPALSYGVVSRALSQSVSHFENQSTRGVTLCLSKDITPCCWWSHAELIPYNCSPYGGGKWLLQLPVEAKPQCSIRSSGTTPRNAKCPLAANTVPTDSGN